MHTLIWCTWKCLFQIVNIEQIIANSYIGCNKCQETHAIFDWNRTVYWDVIVGVIEIDIANVSVTIIWKLISIKVESTQRGIAYTTSGKWKLT